MVNVAWGGRFQQGTGTADAFLAYSSSLAEDAVLIPYDVAGSIAHAEGLAVAGVLTTDECSTLVGGLRAVHEDLASGHATLLPEHEDVHMNVEALLKSKVGDVAGKLHTARSRNDQVALDTRLFARDALARLAAGLAALSEAFLSKAAAHAHVPMPGLTHLQPAQPITVGHWLHARAVQAARDANRALDAFAITNVSPLGAGALAGTSFPIQPEVPATRLGFDGAFANSLDAVGDRDFILDALHAANQSALHLAAFAEELVLYSGPSHGYVKLPAGYTTGSSIMPQKRNPDAAELIRGRTGRVTGAYMQVAMTTKALPLAYNRDLQEVKAPLLAGLVSAIDTVQIATAVVQGLEVDESACAKHLVHGFLEATEIADHLAKKGVPFREAHHVSGRLVALAESRGVPLSGLTWADFEAAHTAFSKDILDVLDARRVPAVKTSAGGTAPERVLEAVKAARAALESLATRQSHAAAKVATVPAILNPEVKPS